MSANSNFDALLSTTLKYYEPKIADEIFDDLPLWYWLHGRGRGEGQSGKAMDTISGGNSIVVPLLYGENTTAKSYSGYELLDTTPQDDISAAEFNWKQLSVSIAISGIEEFKNSSKHKIIDLLNTKKMQAVMTLKTKLNEQAYADGTGNGGKDITGLQALIADAPSTGTLAGINRANYTWWRNQSTNNASFAANGLDDMRTLYNTCSKGNDSPDLIISGQTPFELYEKTHQSQQRFVDTKTMDAGFTNLKFKNAVMMFDNDCASTRMYFINSRYLRLKMGAGMDMKTTPFVKPNNQDAKVAQILFYGNLTINVPARLGVLHSISA
jgi:hypothetical protein